LGGKFSHIQATTEKLTFCFKALSFVAAFNAVLSVCRPRPPTA